MSIILCLVGFLLRRFIVYARIVDNRTNGTNNHDDNGNPNPSADHNANVDMKDIALITLHGMGDEDDHYHVPFQQGLASRLGEAWEKVAFHSVNYAQVLQKPQNALWQKMLDEPANDMSFKTLRQFFLHSFGDAGSLEYSARHNEEKYLASQREIQRTLAAAYEELGGDPTKPIIVVAHSLGCQVICNYLWDSQHDRHIFSEQDRAGVQQFMRLDSLCQLITIGCNIPLFISGIERRECFAPPNDVFQWDNYYDPDDVLGWPLAQLGESYGIVNDKPLDVGPMLTGWTPLSHTQYWADEGLIKQVAEGLHQQLQALRQNVDLRILADAVEQ